MASSPSIENINTDEILNHIMKIETLSHDLRNSIEKSNKNEQIINDYKSMIQFLLENQSIKQTEFDTLIHGNVFTLMDRKGSVQYVQSEIAKLSLESKDIKNDIDNKKKEIVNNIATINEVNYLDRDIYEYVINEIEHKFKRKNKDVINEENSDDED